MAETWARSVQDNPNTPFADYAKSEITKIEAMRTPMELSFTALDGRKVNLAALRGKVVVLDFWGTWCGPCVEEVPFMRKLYATYHDSGLEIVGILTDQLSPEKIAEFLHAHEITWPQYYDGKADAVAKRFSIRAYPTVMALDKRGIMTTYARGEALEAEVKRLLGR